MKKVYKEEIIDHRTGEIMTTIKRFERYGNNDKFMYFSLSDYWYADLLGSEMKVLFAMASIENPHTRQININREIKEILGEKIGVCVNQFENAIRGLMKKNKIKRKTKGVYLINPDLLWIGNVKSKVEKQNDYENH